MAFVILNGALHWLLVHKYGRKTVGGQPASVISRALISVPFMFLLHGANSGIIMAIYAAFWCIAASRFISVAAKKCLVWSFALTLLKLLDVAKTSNTGFAWWGAADTIARSGVFLGVYRHWEVLFNLTVLKMLSFALDWCDMQQKQASLKPKESDPIIEQKIKQCDSSCAECVSELQSACRKARIAGKFLQPSDFSFVSFFAYVQYFPAYVAGPILTFNDWKTQVNRLNDDTLPRSKPLKQALITCTRSLLVAFLTFEAFNHVFFVRYARDHLLLTGKATLTFVQVVAYIYLSLKFIWLKLLIIWRFFRVAQLADGVVAPENQLRCMTNSYSVADFWRAWHASFNAWIVRYIYVPLGGNRTAWWNVWLVFGFAAIFHEFTCSMLAWGALIPLLMLPELAARRLAEKTAFSRRSPLFFALAVRLGGAFNVILMWTANAVGYALDLETVRSLLKSLRMREECSLLKVSVFIGALIAVIHAMMAWRTYERTTLHRIKNF